MKCMRKLLNTLYIVSPEVYCRLDGENIVLERGESGHVRLPLHNLESVVIFSYKGISPALLGKCVAKGIDVVFYSQEGRFLARFVGEHNGNVLLRREQYRIADDDERRICLARRFVLGKVFNCRWILERMYREHDGTEAIEEIKNASVSLRESLKKIDSTESIQELMGLEGDCAKRYFSVFGSMILNDSSHFMFTGRQRRPPTDPVNALLSFAYSLLSKECAAALSGAGLDPYVGFLHSDRPGRTSLALDLCEELRGPVADRFVLRGINLRIFSHNMFTFQDSGAVLLNAEGRKVFLQEWQKHKKETIKHPFLQEKIEWGLVPFVQALLLARTIRGDYESYPPFMWK